MPTTHPSGRSAVKPILLVTCAVELPNIHRDPADRFIIATALIGNIPVVTADRRFAQYGVETLG